jgi:hypothetical protein
MKKIALLAALFVSVVSHAQVAVGTSTATMNASAQLEVTSNTKGFLPPRMTESQRNAISSPAQGLMVYCTDCGTNGQAQVFNGTAWTNIIGTSALAPGVTVPTVSTTAISAITNKSFSSGGTVSATGGSPILAQGICYSTHTNSTLADGGVISGSTASTFVCSVGLLSPNTTYYVRAYATNVAGTTYGNELSFRTIISVGDSYGGGVVAYLSVPGDLGYDANTPHGLIYSGVTSWLPWGCEGTAINGADGIGYGSGNQNTIDIVNGCSAASIAARYCYDYSVTVNGVLYDDWFLPSKDELNKLFINKSFIGLSASGTIYYWSSTEYAAWPTSWVWFQNFFTGGQDYYTNKNMTNYASPVRYF